MEQISPDAPEHILFGIYYNSGIALYEKGHYEKASEFFKKAMSLDSNNVNAKINYELSKKQNTLVKDSQTEISKMIESKKQSTIENAVFTIIKEEEKERWQSQISNENISAQNDY
jgi:Ca-activated chloride channel family protein